jgi:hypothetical protein
MLTTNAAEVQENCESPLHTCYNRSERRSPDIL